MAAEADDLNNVAILSEHHFAAFGRIITFYAMIEDGVKLAICGITNIEMHEALILTEPCSASALRNVARSIMKGRLGEPHLGEFLSIMDRWEKLSPLRTAIAHRRWTNGSRQGAVRPMYVDIRAGRARLFGLEDSERDYTLQELQQYADEALGLNVALVKFIGTAGLADAIQAKLGGY